MSYLTNPYRFTVAAQVIWSADFTGSGGYQVYRTETSTLPVSGDTYFFGTNNNGGGGGCSSASPSWSTGTSNGTWTVTGNSAEKSDGTWGVNYIFGKSATGSVSQTATDIKFDDNDTALWVGFLRSSDLSGTKNDEAVCRYGWYLDNGGGYTTALLNGVGNGNQGGWTTSSKFKIELISNIKLESRFF